METQENSENIRKFKGFSSPRYTQVPDEIFDFLLPLLSGAELKVLFYICRRTFGFKKDSDAISLVQISGGITTKDGRVLDGGTGLSKRHVQRAIKRLEELNAVRVIRKLDDEGVNEVNIYTLKFIDEGVGTKSPHGRDMAVMGVGTPVSPTIYSKQDTDKNVNVTKEGKGEEPKTAFDASNHPPVSKNQTPPHTKTVPNPAHEGGGQAHESKTVLHDLPNLDQPPEKTSYIAEDILKALGDAQSKPFYTLVAAKIPESVIRQKLSEIKQGNARSPARVFASVMKDHAATMLSKQKLQALSRQYDTIGKLPFAHRTAFG